MMSRICLVLLLLFVVTGCAIQQKPKDELTYLAQDFAKRVAWKDYSRAALHFDNEFTDGFLVKFSDTDLLNIVDISVLSVGDTLAEQTEIGYRISYYKLPSTRLVKREITLPWKYITIGNGRIKEWRIVSPFPDLDVTGKNR